MWKANGFFPTGRSLVKGFSGKGLLGYAHFPTPYYNSY